MKTSCISGEPNSPEEGNRSPKSLFWKADWSGAWSRDVSEAMAHKVREIAEQEDYELTQGTLDFIDAHIGRVVQPTLPLW